MFCLPYCPPMHDIQVCGELVTKLGFTGQLEDPVGMVFNQYSLEHSVKVFQRAKVHSSWHDLGVCMMSYCEDILICKRHGKWVISFHKSMDAVDGHKREIILKIGHCMRRMSSKEI